MLLFLRILPADRKKMLPLVRKQKPWTYSESKPEPAPGLLSIFQIIYLIVWNLQFSVFVLEHESLLILSRRVTFSAVFDLGLGAADVGCLVAAQSCKCRQVKGQYAS